MVISTRAAVAVLLVLLPVGLTGLTGCGAKSGNGPQAAAVPEKTQVENAVREGLAQKTGTAPDAVELQPDGDKRYKGTAKRGEQVWDVTATVEKTEIKWQAKQRHTGDAVTFFAVDAIRKEIGERPQGLTLTETEPGVYKGTGMIGDPIRRRKLEYIDVTARIVGDQILCTWNTRPLVAPDKTDGGKTGGKADEKSGNGK
ncbi:MAG: hypothetical protein J0I06_23560 [Planctomycetes bacterium]|nr:hypothetical protein [Planctomycetota bacterium]